MVFINQRTLSFLSALLLFLLSPLTAHCTLSLESDDWNVCLQGGLGVHSEFRNLVTLLRVMTKAEWQASENNGWPMVRVILSEPFFQLYNKWFEPYAPIVSESTIKTEAGVLGQPEDGRGGAGDSGERQIRCMSAFDNKSGFFVQSSPQALKAVVKKLQLKSEVVAEARGIIASKYSTGLVAVHGTTNARACETAQQRGSPPQAGWCIHHPEAAHRNDKLVNIDYSPYCRVSHRTYHIKLSKPERKKTFVYFSGLTALAPLAQHDRLHERFPEVKRSESGFRRHLSHHPPQVNFALMVLSDVFYGSPWNPSDYVVYLLRSAMGKGTRTCEDPGQLHGRGDE